MRLLSSPSFVKRGLGGDLTTVTYLKLISPTPLYKRGLFYDVSFSDFIGNVFERD